FRKYDKQSGKFCVKSEDIRDNNLQGLFVPKKFNKIDFEEIVTDLKSNLDITLLQTIDSDTTQKEVSAQNRFDSQTENFNLQENLEKLWLKVKSILEDTAPESISFPEIKEYVELFDWVQKGIPIHKDSKECKFCTNQLPTNRIDDLNSF